MAVLSPRSQPISPGRTQLIMSNRGKKDSILLSYFRTVSSDKDKIQYVASAPKRAHLFSGDLEHILFGPSLICLYEILKLTMLLTSPVFRMFCGRLSTGLVQLLFGASVQENELCGCAIKRKRTR